MGKYGGIVKNDITTTIIKTAFTERLKVYFSYKIRTFAPHFRKVIIQIHNF